MYYKTWYQGKWEVRNTETSIMSVFTCELEAEQHIARLNNRPIPWALVGQEINILEPAECVGGTPNPNYGTTHRGIVTRVDGDIVDALVYHSKPVSSSCLEYKNLKPAYKAKASCLCWGPTVEII